MSKGKRLVLALVLLVTFCTVAIAASPKVDSILQEHDVLVPFFLPRTLFTITPQGDDVTWSISRKNGDEWEDATVSWDQSTPLQGEIGADDGQQRIWWNFKNYGDNTGHDGGVTHRLDVKVNGSDKTVREIANPDIVNAVSVNGGNYLISCNENVGGLYYNKAMFDEHGWEVPQTWDEFVALCAEIKAAGIAPLAYPGMYPYYFDCFLFPQILALGDGEETLKDYNNLKPGFWTSEPVKQAMERVEFLRDNGYFLDNLIGLSHTETQMEFINGNVAIICCGSWLENEMSDSWPEGFDLHFMITPATANASDERFIQLSGHLFGFPSAAKNKEWNSEFLAAYFSEESAVKVAKECGVVICPEYVAENEEIREALPKSVVETFTQVNENSGYYMLASKWYSEWYSEYQNLLDQLVDGQISADEFCTTMEQNTEALRNDSSIAKYTVG